MSSERESSSWRKRLRKSLMPLAKTTLAASLISSSEGPLQYQPIDHGPEYQISAEEAHLYQPDMNDGIIILGDKYGWGKTPEIDGEWSYYQDHGRKPPHTFFSNYKPEIGLWSGNDPSAMEWAYSNMLEAGIEAVSLSWFGRDHKTDLSVRNEFEFFKSEKNPHKLVRAAIHYEKEGDFDPSVSELREDFGYIWKTFVDGSEYYLRMKHPNEDESRRRPVLIAYGRDEENIFDVAERYREANRDFGFFIILRPYGLLEASRYVGAQPDLWAPYRPANNYEDLGGVIGISARFDMVGEPAPRLPADPDRFRNDIRRALYSKPEIIRVHTFGELGEGTDLLPSERVIFTAQGHELDETYTYDGDLYIEIMSEEFPPPAIISNGHPIANSSGNV